MAFPALFFSACRFEPGMSILTAMRTLPDEMFEFLLEWEGTEYECDPADPGGATKYGIDQRSHPHVDIRVLTEENARFIYEQEWTDSLAAHLDPPLASLYFDAEVNCGRASARRFAQGNADAATQLERRRRYYRGLADEHPGMRKFLHGWINRTNALARLLGIEE